MFHTVDDKVSWVASEDTWIEGEALRQLSATASLPGMLKCIGMPDIQPGKGSPSGAAFLADRIYPVLVGTDGGCGMALWTTDLPVRRVKPERLAERLDGLDRPWDGDTRQFLFERGVTTTDFDGTLGTPGYSNHFIELQAVNKVHDKGLMDTLEIDVDVVHILVHSGSRGYGEAIFVDYAARFGGNALMPDSDDSAAFMKDHYNAVGWAVANRDLCAIRMLDAINATGRRVLDICHNSVRPFEGMADCACWLHRKGVAPADRGPVVIPGSRNDLSFLVQPIDQTQGLASLAHGAGRKIARKEARGKIERLYPNRDDLKRNKWGGQVVCGERALLWEEAGECYKDANSVISSLESAGLIKVIASFRPLVTFKSSEGVAEAFEQRRQNWQQERNQARAQKRDRS